MFPNKVEVVHMHYCTCSTDEVPFPPYDSYLSIHMRYTIHFKQATQLIRNNARRSRCIGNTVVPTYIYCKGYNDRKSCF